MEIDYQALLARIERLERQNRRMKLFGALALALVAVVLAVGLATGQAQAQQRDSVAQRFFVVDDQGQRRGYLGMGRPGSGEVGLFLFAGPAGASRGGLVLSASPEDLRLALLTEPGGVLLSAHPEGASLHFTDAADRIRIFLYHSDTDGPALTMRDASGETVFHAP